MYKIKLLLNAVLSLFLMSNVLAQECTFATIKEGPVQKEGASEIRQVLGVDGDHTYMVKRVSKMGPEIHLCKADLEGNETLDKEIKVPEFENHDRKLDFFIMIQKRLWVFSNYSDKKSDNFILTVDEISTSNFELTGTAKVISKTEYKKRRNKGYFFFDKSADDKKILIYAIYPDDKNPGVEYEFSVFDENMNLEWTNQGVLDMDGRYGIVKDFLVTNKGEVVATACEYEDKDSFFSSGSANYQYHFYRFKSDKTSKKFTVELDDKFVTDIKIRSNANGDLSCLGFYSNKPQTDGNARSIFKRKEKAMGVFNISIDSEGKVIKKSMSDFSFSEGAGEEGDEKGKKKKQDDEELTEFDIREVIPTEDGGTILLAEQFYITVTSGSNKIYGGIMNAGPGGNNVTYYYYFNDIVVVKLDAGGNITWNKRVRKKQHDTVNKQSLGYSAVMSRMVAVDWLNSQRKPDLYQTLNDNGGKHCSFLSSYSNKNLYLFFNDHPKNCAPDADPNGKILRAERGLEIAFAAVKMDENGNQKREILYNQSKNSAEIMPMVSLVITPKQVFVTGDKGRKFQFFTVEITN